jgi:PAS domain S-box-containing protein
MGFAKGLQTKIHLKNGQTLDVTLDALPLTFEGEDCMMIIVRTAHMSEKAYDEFQKSEKRYLFIFSNTIDPILVFDNTGKVMDANHSAAKLLGWDRFDLLESSIDELIDGNITNQLDQIIKAQDEENLVVGFKRKNGESFRAGIRSSVFQAEGVSYIQVMVDQANTAGNFISFSQRIKMYLDALKTAHDSFFRENTEEETGKLLGTIGEAALASAVIWISSTKGKKSKSGFEEKSRWDSTKEGKSDFSADKIFTQLFSPSLPQWAENIAKGNMISSFISTCSSEERRLLEDTGLGGFAAAPIRSDKHKDFIVLAWMDPKTSLTPDETILIKIIVDGFRNALDAKKKEDGFDISEKMLEGFFKISPDIIYIRTESGLFKTVNERFASLLNMEPEEIIEKPLKDILPSNICGRFEQNLKMIIETNAPAQFIINLNEHSVEKVFHIMEFPFYKSSGGETMFAGTGREITDFFTQDDKVRRINAELDEFVHKVSHDLKAPIRNVIGYIEMAEDKGPEGKEYLKKAMNQCTKLQLFIGKLLELSKAGRTVGNFHSFDSNLLIVEVFDLFRNQYPGIELKTEGVLPEVFADRISIMEVFQNLILNALENSDKSKSAPYIKVSANVTDKEIVFIVEDNGIGINKLYLDNIQRSSYNLYEKELHLHGFGLSISGKIIEAHGGRLWAESTEKEGSRFYFSIPTVAAKKGR